MEKKRNNFLDGVVLGTAIGGATVFLLGTKKGREVLKILREEGRERFSQLEGMFSEYQAAMHDEEDYFEDEAEEMTQELPEKVNEVKHAVKESSDKAKSSLRKKLFKGISRKKS